ncbi:MAG: hypothetical protein M8319_02870, partial [Nitrosopumilus sp.]|nr:hypothetical protein [Nitrosopumilus sp.]
LEYTGTGMTVSGIDADLDFISLLLTVDVTESTGNLHIVLPRHVLDSTYQGADDAFIILVDGDEPSFTESETDSQSRTLDITLPAGTEEVEIIGSVFNSPMVSAEETMEEETMEEETMEEETMEEETMEEETMEEETMEETEIVDSTPKTQCGPGTVLKNGACVLDERCGPGTVLKDGACVVESVPQSSGASVNIVGKEMIVGVVAAFVVAIAIIIVLGLMAKASKSKD